MKKITSCLTLFLFLLGFSCQQDSFKVATQAPIPQAIISQLQAAGFVTSAGLSRFLDGYKVEGDIYMTAAEIASFAKEATSQPGGRLDHYRTSSLVTAKTNLTVFIATSFDASVINSLQPALDRFTDQNLVLQFTRIYTSNADITIYPKPYTDDYGSSQFPANGLPGHQVFLNSAIYNDANYPNRSDFVSIICHEIGHAIGFRHTDYFQSCALNGQNEGGDAVAIPGTPTDTQPDSWMYSCSTGMDRIFTPNDIIALHNLYPRAGDGGQNITISIQNNVDPNWIISNIAYSVAGGTPIPVPYPYKSIIINDLQPIAWSATLTNRCPNANVAGTFSVQTGTLPPVYAVPPGGRIPVGIPLPVPSGSNTFSSNYTVTFRAAVHNPHVVTIINNVWSFWVLNEVDFSLDGGATWSCGISSPWTLNYDIPTLFRAGISNSPGNTITGILSIQERHQIVSDPSNPNTLVPAGQVLFWPTITPDASNSDYPITVTFTEAP